MTDWAGGERMRRVRVVDAPRAAPVAREARAGIATRPRTAVAARYGLGDPVTGASLVAAGGRGNPPTVQEIAKGPRCGPFLLPGLDSNQ